MIVACAGFPFELPTTPDVAPPGITSTQPNHWVAAHPGLFSVDGELVVVLHRSQSKAASFTTLRHVQRHVGSLARYYRRRQRSVEGSLETFGLRIHGRGIALLDRAEAALALWADYQSDGLLTKSSEQADPRQPGRVDWRRSTLHGVPLQSPSGLTFLTLYRRSVRRDPQHPLARVHRAALYGIARDFGLGRPDVPAGLPSTTALALLQRHGREAFTDRHRRLVGLLERYFTATPTTPSHQQTPVKALWAHRFEYLWEDMLRVALGHRELEQDTFRGSYQHTDGCRSAGLRLRPDLLVDTVLHGRSVRLVLDAKDYAEGNWPDSQDLTKQLMYRLLLSDRLDPKGRPLSELGNAFLFPAATEHGVERRGTHDLDTDAGPNAPGHIVGLNVDLERIQRSYLDSTTDRQLLTAITLQLFPDLLNPSSVSC